VLKRARER